MRKFNNCLQSGISLLTIIAGLFLVNFSAYSQTSKQSANKPDSFYCPGEYFLSGLVAYDYNLHPNHTFKITRYDCSGKSGEDTGLWIQKRDTVILKYSNRNNREVFLIKTSGLYYIDTSENRIITSSRVNYKCHKKYYIDGKTKCTYHYSANNDTVTVIGYYPNGNIQYLSTYNLFEIPIAQWYYFNIKGGLTKTVNYSTPVIYSKRKKRR